MSSNESKISSGEDMQDNIKSLRFIKSYTVSSPVPLSCKESPCILGVDEAGRGPVLGPMVYGVCYVPIMKKDDLKDLGCADSKTLTEKKREELFSILCSCDDYVGWSVDIISPNFICNLMLKRSKQSLNEIAQESTVGLIKGVLASGANITEIYVDTVGPPEKYQDRLSKIFPQCQVTVSKKADSIFPIVSAASICAKVTRDRCIQGWQFPEGVENPEGGFGSGYPNDPDTKQFLNSNIDDIFGFPHLVRFSWSTASKLLENATPVEWDEEGASADNKAITSFFKLASNMNKHEMKHKFFKERLLANIDTF